MFFFSHFLDFITFTFYDLFAEIAYFPFRKRKSQEEIWRIVIGPVVLLSPATVARSSWMLLHCLRTSLSPHLTPLTPSLSLLLPLSPSFLSLSVCLAILWQIQSTLLLIDSA